MTNRGYYTKRGTFIAVIVALLIASEAFGSPRLAVEKMTHDAGMVSDEEPIQAMFSIRNTGSSTLEIKPKLVSCRCVSTTQKTVSIPPLTELAVPVSLSTRGRSGQQKHSAVFSTNDPDHPSLALSISAYIRPLLFMKPRAVHLELTHGCAKSASSEVKVMSTNVDLSTLTAALPGRLDESVKISAKFEREEGKGNTGTLTLCAMPAQSLGRFKTSVTLQFRHDGRICRRVLPVALSVASPFIDSTEAYLGIVAQNTASGSKTSRIQCRKGVRVKALECSLKTVTAEIHEEGKQIRVTYVGSSGQNSARLKKGLVEGQLTMYFEGGEHLSMPITYYALANVQEDPRLRLSSQKGVDVSDKTFAGRVVNSSGAGIADATVHLHKMGEDSNKLTIVSSTRTDRNGAFKVSGVLDKTIIVSVVAPDYAARDHVDLMEHGDNVVELKRSSTIHGKVISRDGKPLVLSRLSLSTYVKYRDTEESTANDRWATTDRHGCFTIKGIPPGVHMLCCRWKDSLQKSDTGEIQTTTREAKTLAKSSTDGRYYGVQIIKVGEGREVRDICIDLSQSICGIEGYVRDTRGKVVEGAKVSMMWQHRGGASSLHEKGFEPAVTDKNGYYFMGNLPPGKWALVVSHGLVKESAKSTVINLVRRKTIQQDLLLPKTLPDFQLK